MTGHTGVPPEQRLIDLAERATKGPWHVGGEGSNGAFVFPVVRGYIANVNGRDAVTDINNAHYIAAADPQTIKALAEVVRAARSVAFSDDVLPKTVEEAVLHLGALEERIRALTVSIRALDSQEEQQR